MMPAEKPKAVLYIRYPLSSVVLYNGVTLLHFALGALGLLIGYEGLPGSILGIGYLAFALVQMYGIMPMRVCPNCVYLRMENARCISGMNIVAKRVTQVGNPDRFAQRAKGMVCHNNLYMGSLFAPILLMIPVLILNFSVGLLLIQVAVVGLLGYRFCVLFSKKACVHCYAKYQCPNAEMMKLRDS